MDNKHTINIFFIIFPFFLSCSFCFNFVFPGSLWYLEFSSIFVLPSFYFIFFIVFEFRYEGFRNHLLRWYLYILFVFFVYLFFSLYVIRYINAYCIHLIPISFNFHSWEARRIKIEYTSAPQWSRFQLGVSTLSLPSRIMRVWRDMVGREACPARFSPSGLWSVDWSTCW